MTKHNITNERGNIPVELPLREYVIKKFTTMLVADDVNASKEKILQLVNRI